MAGPPIVKIVLLGDTETGKSCLLLRYAKDTWEGNYSPTVSAEFWTRNIALDDDPLHVCKFQICDASGSTSYRPSLKSFYSSASAAVVLFDVSNRASFYSVEKWIDEARLNLNQRRSFMAMIGHKIDLDRAVTLEEAEKLARKLGVTYYQASSKTGEGVEDVFSEILQSILEQEGHLVESEKCDSGMIDAHDMTNDQSSGIPNNVTTTVDISETENSDDIYERKSRLKDELVAAATTEAMNDKQSKRSHLCCINSECQLS